MNPSDAAPAIRIGHGYDLHRLEPVAPDGPGRPFVLGGVGFDHDRGPVGHSDGDALLHAVTDALLGALGREDIGQLFPDSAPEWDNADSTIFLAEALDALPEKSLPSTIVPRSPLSPTARVANDDGVCSDVDILASAECTTFRSFVALFGTNPLLLVLLPVRDFIFIVRSLYRRKVLC